MTPTPTLTTSSTPITTWQRRGLTGLCWLLALSFIAGGLAKFAPGETFAGAPYSERFADWGYPSWFRFLVGAARSSVPCCSSSRGGGSRARRCWA